MVTKTPFLNTPYGGYLHSQVPSEDEEITHVGPGTLAGEWFRRFWQPVAVSEDLKDLPVAIRILGEDLVLFRDRSGQIGLLELHCSHRGTSLGFGQIEERGIRCCYHAWHYDVDGKLLETPGEPAESTLKDRLYHGAYPPPPPPPPTHEHGGLVFAYMGPADQRPAFPIFDTYDMPGYRSAPRTHMVWPCNWLQVTENAMDPVHFLFLHAISGNIGFTEEFKEVGEIDFMETPIGMVYIDTRRFGYKVWVRVTDYTYPAIHQGCDLGGDIDNRDLNGPTITTWTVPIDDTHTMRIGFSRAREGEELSRGGGFGQSLDRPYEERQRTPGDYDAQVSQRPIEVHALEHLATSDRGVIVLRNMTRRGIRGGPQGRGPPSGCKRGGEGCPYVRGGEGAGHPPGANTRRGQAATAGRWPESSKRPHKQFCVAGGLGPLGHGTVSSREHFRPR